MDISIRQVSSILSIETSAGVCSVALGLDGECLLAREDRSGHGHAEKLGPYVQETLSYAESHGIPIDAVAVSGGPGSYTGLRIGASMAKGICYGRGCKLVSVPTLEVLCVPVLLELEPGEGDLLCPMIDARRMEVYAAVYDRALGLVRPVRADIVDGSTYLEYLERGKVWFFGDGACKCMEAIGHPNAVLARRVEPLARHMLPLAEKRLALSMEEDVAYYAPFYLKDFAAKPPRKLL